MYNFSDEVKDASYNGDKSSTQENSGRTPERRTIPRVEEAIQLLTEAGTKYQHPDALFLLGELYFHGLYAKERNFTSALDYYEQLADLNGNATAQQRTGFIYSIGLGQTVADPRKALLYTTFAGVGGDTVAEMTLGYRYLYGLGVPKSCEESVYYYQRVADKAIDYYESGPPGGRRLPRPRIRLADEEGGVFGIKPAGQSTNGVELDEVIEFYRLEAEKGNLQAKLILGQLYQRGSNRIKQDYRRAIRYYRSVALQVYSSNGKQKKTKNVDEHVAYLAAQAAAFIGEMFWRGEGVKANTATAIRWFKHAIEYNDPVAYNALGVMYRDGNGVRKDLKLAIEYFQKAASKEYDEAQVNMGKIMYASKSYADARYFFMAAAGNGNILAQYYLADMHWEGQGTSYSCPLAVAYYKTVAEKGDWQYSPIPAGYQAYKRGDYETALLVYLQAAEMGYEVAQTNAAWLIDNQRHGHLNMTPSYGQLALSLWMRAANQGNTDARIKSGDYYYNGIGTPQDPKQAAKCYHSVARNDVSDLAMWNLGWMHEHGIGDFYLADRWYKRALEINPNAYFPVVFSRIKLYIHWAWDWLTNLEFLNWSSSSTGDSTHKHKTGKSTGQEGLDGLDDEEDGLMNDDDDEDDIFSEKLAWEEPDDLVDIEDELINGWDWRRGADLPDEYNDQDEE
ncbi:hypothetical protein BDF19DRAFT_381633 [Syncephalis fuscata]|nr:hypothetical protein BDF19DRAFT_381633 [Syncephalis fuscata]